MTEQRADEAPRDPRRTSRGGSSGWRDVAKQSWDESGQDNLGLIASGIAFNAFLAVIPLMTSVVLTYGLVASPQQVAAHIATLANALPEQAAEIIGGQLRNMVDTATSSVGFGLLATVAITLYGAIRGASGVIVGLNIIYNVEESRSTGRQMAVALAITAGLILVFIVASVAISFVNLLAAVLPDMGGVLRNLLQVAFWIGAAMVVSLVIAMIYRFAPNREEIAWKWFSPGSVFATLVWIAATFAFSFYVQNFGNYNAVYGALGAVIVFLTWLYLSAYILLLGAELNQVLERRAANGG